jgi:hypothetical protein
LQTLGFRKPVGSIISSTTLDRVSRQKDTLRPQHQAADEQQAWLDIAPVGREFGSPDYECLTALDQAAFAAFRSWEQVRDWLATPHPQLDGICPEDAARNPDGLSKVMPILMMAGIHASNDFMREAEKIPVQERDSFNGLADIQNLKGMFGRPSKRASIEDMNAAIARRGAKKK